MAALLSFDFGALPIWFNILTLIVVIPVIAVAADFLVDGSSSIARRMGVSELIVGLTVVSFGTSAPEMAVSIGSALNGLGNVALGNVVGSNVFNVGLILGGCAIIRTIPCSRTLLVRDVFVLAFGAAALTVMVALDYKISRWEGAALIGILLTYLILVFRQRSHGESEGSNSHDNEEDLMPIPKAIAKTVMGLVLILGMSHILVFSATAVAKSAGISDWVIGVTIVAAGTSTPEFATSLIGVLRGRYGIAAGNIVGSDMMNLLGVVGVAALINPFEVEPVAAISLAGVFVTILMLGVFIRSGGWRLSKKEGIALVCIGLFRWGADIYFSSV